MTKDIPFFHMIINKEFLTDYKDKIRINKNLLSMHLVDSKTPAKMINLVFHRYYMPLTIGFITLHFLVRLYLIDTLTIIFHGDLKRVYSNKENGNPDDLSYHADHDEIPQHQGEEKQQED